MEIKEYIKQKKDLYYMLLNFIDNESNDAEYEKLTNIIQNHQIKENSRELEIFLKLIQSISINHYRSTNFFEKIEQILSFLLDAIRSTIEKSTISDIFRGNKRLLLYFMTNDLIEQPTSDEYFSPVEQLIETEPDFEEKRLNGVNDSYFCSLIRQDLIEDFIQYVNLNNIKLTSEIEPSLFETNQLLLSSNAKIIEYAAFYGSIQIFNYLINHGVTIKPDLYVYAIHSQNAEIFNILEESDAKLSLEKCLREAISCHHNEFVQYIIDNYNNSIVNASNIAIEFFNFAFFPDELNQENYGYLIQNDYCTLVKFLVDGKLLTPATPIIYLFILK